MRNEAGPPDSADRLRAALDFSGVGEWSWDAETDAVTLSPVACTIFGLEPGCTITWTEMRRDLLHPEDAPRAAGAVVNAIEDHTQYTIEYRVRLGSGGEGWVMASGKAFYRSDGAVAGMIGLVQDITERRQALQALDEESDALNILNRTGSIVASELDTEKVVQAVTDAGVSIIGAQFGAFFYNVVNASGEQYMLYTLSGVPREAFSRFPMPRNTPVFAPTFSGTGIVRSDDILKDPRYGTMGPHRGMPKGHLPVRSYLAVPVISRGGEVTGGLFFGHAEPGHFSARDERVMVGIAAQAAIAIDNARLFQRAQREIDERRKAEDALRGLADALETRVRDRTNELEEANRRLAEQIAEREKAEEALRQSQKLEALGHLTGGVAHDFNNLLTVVIGNLDLVQRRLPQGSDPRITRAVEVSLEASRRATGLTQRLLAFARRQPLDPKPLDPNRLVQGMSDIFHRTISEAIEVQIVLGAGIWMIEADLVQLENALLNLVLNARDAMPEGGKLTIETGNMHLDAAYAAAHAVAPGQYVMISVTDTGIGIPRDMLDKVIEPFFTTKPIGQGTGLGLSQVYGFVKQSAGNVRIYSESGDGTTVKIYLPRHFGEAAERAELPGALGADAGETVLIVEDEEEVRRLAASYFEELGYRVLLASDGPTALDILSRADGVDLLFTDVGLPKMNGRQLAEEARRRRPNLKVLFTTGYARNAIVHQGRLDPGVDLLGKPYTFSELSERVRDVLDRKG
jgi:PAS domain S-box-containing protein